MELGDLFGALKRYAGGDDVVSNPPAETQQDFEQLTKDSSAQPGITQGLTDIFRSNQTPPFGQMLGNMFSQSNGEQKAGILNQLLGAVGPAALGSGALGGLASMLGGGNSVSAEQAEKINPNDVTQLAEHAEKENPSIVDQASQFYAQHPQLVQALGAGALALLMQNMTKSRKASA